VRLSETSSNTAAALWWGNSGLIRRLSVKLHSKRSRATPGRISWSKQSLRLLVAHWLAESLQERSAHARQAPHLLSYAQICEGDAAQPDINAAPRHITVRLGSSLDGLAGPSVARSAWSAGVQ
jgi:hypothetical protein